MRGEVRWSEEGKAPDPGIQINEAGLLELCTNTDPSGSPRGGFIPPQKDNRLSWN